jgi:hypothetical protein
VRYTVWSRGHLIGDTDLGFVRVIEQSRWGWFHPNAEGERRMPVIAAPLPAVRAYLQGVAMDAQGDPTVRPELRGSTLFADLAEAFQHLESLDLELRREDGSVVPTSEIGIQDMHQLLALADEEENASDAGSWDDDDLLETLERDPQGEAEVMSDMDLSDEWTDEPSTQWTMEDLEEPQFPRYQIYVRLLHDDAIPCGPQRDG